MNHTPVTISVRTDPRDIDEFRYGIEANGSADDGDDVSAVIDTDWLLSHLEDVHEAVQDRRDEISRLADLDISRPIEVALATVDVHSKEVIAMSIYDTFVPSDTDSEFVVAADGSGRP